MKKISLTVRAKINLLSVVLLCIISIIGYLGINGMTTMYNESRSITEKAAPATDLLLNIDRDAQQSLVALRSILLFSGNAEVREKSGMIRQKR